MKDMFPAKSYVTRFALALVIGSACGNAQPKLKEVIVVYKTHFDIGYTALTSEVIERYRTSMIDKALNVVDASKALPPDQRFAWTIPGWPTKQILWDGQAPERRKRVLDALRAGQFVNHALPFTTHTESLDLEDLVRGMEFSSGIARSLNFELPRDAKMTDVPCHSWILPTMLKHAGVSFLHIGSNGMSSGPELPSFGTFEKTEDGKVLDRRQALFWWEGPDGSRVLTMYSRKYGSSLAPPADWPYRTWLALIHTGDNAGPPTTEAVEKLLEEAKTVFPGAKVRFGRFSDFADALMKENPKLPVVRGDMPDPWIHGLMSMPAETAQIRNTRPEIGALEALNTLLGSWTGQEDASKTIAQAYEQSLLYGEHTWGYDAKRFPRTYGAEWQADRAAGKFTRMEKSWDEHRDYTKRAAELTDPQLDRNLKALSAAMQVEGKRIAVFNSLAWVRDGLVETEFTGAAPAALRDAATGALIPVEAEGGKLRFIAQKVPAMGYRTYVFAEKASPARSGLIVDEKSRVIENQFFRVTLDPVQGRIASVFDKSAKRELVDTKAEFGFGQYIHEQFSADDMQRFVNTYTKGKGGAQLGDFGKPKMPAVEQLPHRATSPRNLRLRMERGPVSVTAVMESEKQDGAPYPVELAVSLYDGQPYVNIGWRVKDKAATPAPEGGWLSFPLAVARPQFRLARLGAVIDPAKDTIIGTNHDVYALTGGVAVLDSKLAGAGICPIDSPLVSLDHPGLWEYTKQFSSTKPRVFVNLYNNLWGTNFAQWNEGSWQSRVRLWSIGGYEPFAGVVRPSMEARAPLRGDVEDGPAGKLTVSKAGLRISRPGVIVTALGKNPDGAGRLLRLWEQAGKDGTANVCLPDAPDKVQAADLRGRPQGKPIAVAKSCFTTELKHYAPASFIY